MNFHIEPSPEVERFFLALLLTSDMLGKLEYIAYGHAPHPSYCAIGDTGVCSCAAEAAVVWATTEAAIVRMIGTK